MIPKYENLDQIALDELNALVEGSYREDEYLDFKRDYSYKAKPQDWCKDISALANTHGGCIIIGLDEDDDACAKELVGVDIDIDEAVRRMHQIANASIRPRIAIREHIVTLDDGRKVLLLATPKSRTAPHMEMQTGRCWRRSGGGNELMDIEELRASFNISVSAEDRARIAHESFVAGLPALAQGEMGIAYSVVPAYDQIDPFDPADRDTRSKLTDALLPIIDQIDRRITIDGWHGHQRGSKDRLIVLRSGEIYARRVYVPIPGSGGDQILPSAWFPQQLHHHIKQLQKAYSILDQSLPVTMLASLEGMLNRRLTATWSDPQPIDRDTLSMPPLLFESTADDWFESVLLWLDRLWNACGMERCPIKNPESGEIDFRRLERI